MKTILIYLVCIAVFSSCISSNRKTDPKIEPINTIDVKDKVMDGWGRFSMDLLAYDIEKFKTSPEAINEKMGLLWTAIYDAWSRYDTTASPVYLLGIARRPVTEWNNKNIDKATNYAAFTTLKALFPIDSNMINDRMRAIGLDPLDQSTSPISPIGIGNLAANNTLEAWKKRNEKKNK